MAHKYPVRHQRGPQRTVPYTRRALLAGVRSAAGGRHRAPHGALQHVQIERLGKEMHVGQARQSIEIRPDRAGAQNDRYVSEHRIVTGEVDQLPAAQGVVIPDEHVHEDQIRVRGR